MRTVELPKLISDSGMFLYFIRTKMCLPRSRFAKEINCDMNLYRLYEIGQKEVSKEVIASVNKLLLTEKGLYAFL